MTVIPGGRVRTVIENIIVKAITNDAVTNNSLSALTDRKGELASGSGNMSQVSAMNGSTGLQLYRDGENAAQQVLLNLSTSILILDRVSEGCLKNAFDKWGSQIQLFSFS